LSRHVAVEGTIPDVPLYEELLRRAIEAQDRARGLHTDARRIRELAQLLREAGRGERLLLRCAWCGSIQVGDEWLHLDAIGRGEQSITARLVAGSTHGICPECFDRVMSEAEAERRPRQ
jgi:hypothetical protein